MSVMMKLLLMVFMVSLMCIGSGITSAATDRERDGLVGPVRKIVMEKARVSFLSTSGRDARLEGVRTASWQQERVSSIHPVLRSERAQHQGELWRTIAYNTHGNRTAASFYTRNETRRWTWRYVYDVHDHRIERTSYGADDAVRGIQRYRYDTRGKLNEQTEYNSEGDLERRWRYEYDAADHVIEETHTMANGSLVWKWRYTYNGKGKRIGKRQYTTNDTLAKRWRYTYDDQGHLQSEISFDGSGNRLGKRHYFYNARGDVSEEHRYNADGSLSGKRRYTYLYDTVSNWIKRTKAIWVMTAGTAFFEPSEITYRTLTYD